MGMTEDGAEALRAHGLRVTEPRLAVLRTFQSGQHLEAKAILARVSAELPRTSLQAVYGVLTALTDAGVLRRIEPAGSAALYERRVGDNHHHVVCRECRSVEDIDCVVGAVPCLEPETTAGFQIESAEVTFWGLCPRCAAVPALA